ncbi:MAG: nucleoside-diphosphate kinase [Candidatus Pacebacteria bacterium]|nr:nucleoside-diphosphate kinase [Candidatus Paceibacterota bacterium]
MAKPILKEEQTFMMVKPDGVRRGLTGEIIKRIEQRGLKIVACSLTTLKRTEIDRHYPKDAKWIRRVGEKTLAVYVKYGLNPKKEIGTDDMEKIGRIVREWLLDYMTSGPVLKMIIEGVHAIDMVRKLCGATVPLNAELGSIRGDFSADSPIAANHGKRAIQNLVHASENEAEAKHEIKLWFKSADLHSYRRIEEELML